MIKLDIWKNDVRHMSTSKLDRIVRKLEVRGEVEKAKLARINAYKNYDV